MDLKLKTTATCPLLPVNPVFLELKMAQGIDLTTKGDFVASLTVFRSIIQAATMIAAFTDKEVQKVKTLIGQAVEYVTAMRIELQRQDLRKKDAD